MIKARFIVIAVVFLVRFPILTVAAVCEDHANGKDQVTLVGRSDSSGSQNEVAVAPAKTNSKPKNIIEHCDTLVVSGIKTINENYISKLKLIENQSQLKGDLDGVIAVQREAKRFKTFETVSDEHIVQFPDELRQAQVSQIRAHKDAVDKIINNYIDELNSRKKRLTTEGRIQEAIEIQGAIQSIDSIYRKNPPKVKLEKASPEVSLKDLKSARREILGKWESENSSGWKGVVEFFEDGRVCVDSSFKLNQTWKLTDKGVLIKYNDNLDDFDLYYYPIRREQIIGKRFSQRWGESELTARRID